MAQDTPKPINLTQTAWVARGVIKYGGITLALIMVGRIFWGAVYGYWKALHPAPPPPPTIGFGVLPKITFPTQIEKPDSYKIEIAPSKVPNIPNRMKVFFKPISKPSLNAAKEAKVIAANLGYVFEPQILSDRTYRWTRLSPYPSTLEMDIVTGHFTLKTNWANNYEIFDLNVPIDQTRAEKQLKSMLQKQVKLPEDMATASATITYLKASGGEFIEADSQSDSDAYRINLNRINIDNQIKNLTPDPQKGIISAVFTGLTLLELEYNYQPIDYLVSETYPLRSIQNAWKILSAGEGYVAAKGRLNQAVIRNIYLAYYDGFTQQQYHMPIYVFEGDDGFLGYVEAIDPKFLGVGK